jgi:hypothetical protein
VNFEIYCDESQQELFGSPTELRKGKFTIIGGLWIEASIRQDVKEAIKKLRDKYNLHGEFKWTRVSPSKLAFYLELIDLFFATDSMRFRCLVLPALQLDAIRFHSGDNELMFYKFYYQLLHHWIEDANTYRIFVDMKTNRVGGRLERLREVLASANRFAFVEQIQALPSNEVDLLQLVDVLIGAVSYHFHSRKGSNAKLRVVNRIEEHLGHPIRKTTRHVEKFNVFLWRPGGGW